MTKNRSRRLSPRVALIALVALLAVPAGASATTVAIAPPGLGDGEVSAAARGDTRDDGCRSRNGILFREATLTARVRHFGAIRCGVPTRIRCRALLAHYGATARTIEESTGRGRDRCSMGSRFASSERYAFGERFGDFHRFVLTLRNRRHRWAGTSDYCPERRRNRRVLVCGDAVATQAPRNATERHN